MKLTKKQDKNSLYKIALATIISIILTILIVSLVNVGLTIFLESPDYKDFCNNERIYPIKKPDMPLKCPEDLKVCENGVTLEREPYLNCNYPQCPDEIKECQEKYDKSMKFYNQLRYYVFAGIGFVLLLLGLFATFPMIQFTGLASGAILITQGIVTNFENKITVFISLLLIFIIFSLIAWRVIKKLR